MKYGPIFQDRINCSNAHGVFEYLMATLKDTITKWDYFVNWAKVFANITDLEIDLNILNYLVGKENIEREFSVLLEKHPHVARLIPALIASRKNRFKILVSYDWDLFKYETFDFAKPEAIDRSKVVEFARSTGFLELLQNRKIKNIVDYVIGVEVGLDSNGRKNRGGQAMETIVEFFVKDICDRRSFDYIRDASSARVAERWGLRLKVDKSSRRVDFAINNNDQLFLIETNFYGGGGSKLKSTAREYRSMFDFWKSDGHEFIWITDGHGWCTTRLPLQETFGHTDYILNLDMVSKGILEDILSMSHA